MYIDSVSAKSLGKSYGKQAYIAALINLNIGTWQHINHSIKTDCFTARLCVRNQWNRMQCRV